MRRRKAVLAGAAAIALALVLIGISTRNDRETQADTPSVPVLSVALAFAQESTLPVSVRGTGNVAAWQEAIIGAEVDGLGLAEVRVNVGDSVKRGQVLAVFNADIAKAELAETIASIEQAEAEASEARTNAARARSLEKSRAMSAQQIDQYVVAAVTAQARLDAARARSNASRVRVARTLVRAPSDGVITSRTATVGAVVAGGQELFRLIRDGRLEWRASVSATDLDRLRPGQSAKISTQGREPIEGRLRMLAPAIDTQTHSGLAYVDLPLRSAMRAGEFVTGHFEVGNERVLTVPQAAVLLRDGFYYVMCVGPESRVLTKKVAIGRRDRGRIEITEGLSPSEAVIASGLTFLSEGDKVRVVDEPPRLATQKTAVVVPAEWNGKRYGDGS